MATPSSGRLGAVVAGLILCGLALVSCTHSGQPPTTKQRHLSQGPPRSTSTTASPRATLTARCRSHAGAHGRVVSFRGGRTNTPYCGIVWFSDVVHDCMKHAYGHAVIAFLSRHHCGTAQRTLATVYHANFAVNLSSVATSFQGTARNPLGAEFRFTQLASSRNEGGIADLLRDGHRIPGPTGKPPRTAIYGVYPLNTNVDVIYGWYRQKPSAGYGSSSLKLIEQDVAFSPATG